MFFIFSKALFFLITPICWILACFILASFLKKTRIKKIFLIAGIALLLFFTNTAIINSILHAWEVQTKSAKSVTEKYDYAVVLGGMASQNPKTGALHVGPSIDRLLEAIVLYKQGNVRKILITGGSGAIFSQQQKEALIVNELCYSLGVPKEDVILESDSKNTHENAVFTKNIIGTDKKILLLTSAFHMRRSMGCFAKEGFTFDVFSTDPLEVVFLGPDDYFIPKAEPLYKWTILIKEWIGYVTYKIADYI